MAPRLCLLLAALLLLFTGCGDDEETAAPPSAGGATDLVVSLDPDGPQGPKPAKELQLECGEGEASPACRAVERLKPRDFGPVPDNVACTDIFGGPQTAQIEGTLRGEQVSATFSRNNGCEIHRWEAVAPLLAEVR